jgi:hypothetical protein
MDLPIPSELVIGCDFTSYQSIIPFGCEFYKVKLASPFAPLSLQKLPHYHELVCHHYLI